jgi:hypothetical protein
MKDHIEALVRTIRAAEPRPFPADIQLATFLTAIGVDGPSEACKLRFVLARWSEGMTKRRRSPLSGGSPLYVLPQWLDRRPLIPRMDPDDRTSGYGH